MARSRRSSPSSTPSSARPCTAACRVDGGRPPSAGGRFPGASVGARAVEIAAELAVHFEQGRDLCVRSATCSTPPRTRGGAAPSRGPAHYGHALGLLERLPECRGTGRARAQPADGSRRRDHGDERVRRARGRGGVLPGTEPVPADRRHPAPVPGAVGPVAVLLGSWRCPGGRRARARAPHARRAGDDEGLRLQALHASWATAFSRGGSTPRLDAAKALTVRRGTARTDGRYLRQPRRRRVREDVRGPSPGVRRAGGRGDAYE